MWVVVLYTVLAFIVAVGVVAIMLWTASKIGD